jgi:predicted Fe-Mo cluster-binding NifX family protein
VKIAIATDAEGVRVTGHAGQARHWLVFDCQPGEAAPAPRAIELTREQLPHHFRDDGPHPLHGVEILITHSAGEGFVRHMGKWGAQILLTGEDDPRRALAAILRGAAPADPRFDITTMLCRLRDLFARH